MEEWLEDSSSRQDYFLSKKKKLILIFQDEPNGELDENTKLRIELRKQTEKLTVGLKTIEILQTTFRPGIKKLSITK